MAESRASSFVVYTWAITKTVKDAHRILIMLYTTIAISLYIYIEIYLGERVGCTCLYMTRLDDTRAKNLLCVSVRAYFVCCSVGRLRFI